VTQTTIATDVKAIEHLWLQYDIRTTKWKRSKRVKQLERIARESINAFEKSQQNVEEISTVYTPKPCPDCKGTGFANEIDWCVACEGKGTVMTEVVTKKVKGQAGDSSFLRVFNECIKEIAKLEGLVVKEPLVVKGQITHQHVSTLNINWDRVPNDALLEAKRVWAKITNPQEPLLLEATAIKEEVDDQPNTAE